MLTRSGVGELDLGRAAATGGDQAAALGGEGRKGLRLYDLRPENARGSPEPRSAFAKIGELATAADNRDV